MKSRRAALSCGSCLTPRLVARRFEARVDRSGEHHLWTGRSVDRSGIGQVRVGGRLTTTRRVAWELANGDVPDGCRVILTCGVTACVRVEHLAIVNMERAKTETSPAALRQGRGTPGQGSKRRVRPGVWELSVVTGRLDDGRVRRSYRTVAGGTPDDAKAASAKRTSGSARKRSMAHIGIRIRPPTRSAGRSPFLTSW